MGRLNRLKLLVSVHDVTPVHAARLDRAEALLRSLDIHDVTYLFVPRFHGVPSEEDAAFVRWCQAPRPFRVQWMLHGYLHQERSVQVNGGDPPGAWWKRRFLTGGEGEFLALHGDALHDRLTQGRDIFRRCLDTDPIGFVPPAWLSHPDLHATLREHGFSYTEDHHRLYQLQSDRSRRAPVITWATRTITRRIGSLIVCPVLRDVWRSQPVLRVALHPHDFDYPGTANNIARLLRTLVREREVIGHNDALFDSRVTLA
jgi:predicted deacetylase